MEVEKDLTEMQMETEVLFDLSNKHDPSDQINHFDQKDYSDNNANAKAVFDCEICHKSFTKTKYLKTHQKLHTGQKKYKCEKCDKSYARSDHLKRHLITHSEDTKPFRCEFCIQRFSNKCHMRRHIKIIHNGEKFEYKCEKCELVFNKKNKLSRHMTLHKASNPSSTEEETHCKKYECYYPFCPRTYHSKGKLDLHIEKTHSNTNNTCTKVKKILQCPFEECFKTYTTPYNLKVHIKTFHYQVEEFKCENCDQSFKHKCSLERHQEKFHQEMIQDFSFIHA